jgi:hypothetical protein
MGKIANMYICISNVNNNQFSKHCNKDPSKRHAKPKQSFVSDFKPKEKNAKSKVKFARHNKVLATS